MPQQVRHALILVAVATVVFCARLGATRLWDDDETFFAQTAREMYERGDLVVPTFNQALFSHKPPFMYWMMIAAYHVFGVTEFAARFPSALFGIANVLLIWRLGARLYSPAVGFWAGIMLATSLNFVVVSRAATCDAELVFFCTLPLYIFARGAPNSHEFGYARGGGSRTRESSDTATIGDPNSHEFGYGPASLAYASGFQNPGSPTHERGDWPTYALAYLAMGMAMLVKGPIGIVLPGSVLGLFLLWQRATAAEQGAKDGAAWKRIARFAGRLCSPRALVGTFWSMRPLTAIAAVLLVAGPWFVAVGVKTQGEFLNGFFGVHHFHRFTSPMDNHGGSPFYYLLAICVGFFPWIIFLMPSCSELVRRMRTDHPFRNADRLICAWIIVWVGFFSLASTKFPHYVVPAYPALALLTAAFAERWTREFDIYGKLSRRWAWATVALVSVGIVVAIPFVARIHLPGEELLGLAALPLLPAAVLAAYFTERRQITRALATLTIGAMAFSIGLFGFAAVRVDRHQNTAALAQAMNHAAPASAHRVGTFRYFRPGLVYYCNERVEQLAEAAEARAFLADDRGPAFLVTTEAEFDQMAGLPPDVSVLQRAPWFLRSGRTVVLLGRAAGAVAERSTATRE